MSKEAIGTARKMGSLLRQFNGRKKYFERHQNVLKICNFLPNTTLEVNNKEGCLLNCNWLNDVTLRNKKASGIECSIITSAPSMMWSWYIKTLYRPPYCLFPKEIHSTYIILTLIFITIIILTYLFIVLCI